MKKIRECDMEKFGMLDFDSSKKTVAILGDRWWLQTAKQEGVGEAKKVCNRWKQCNERPNVGGVSVKSRNGALSRKGCMANGQTTRASNK